MFRLTLSRLAGTFLLTLLGAGCAASEADPLVSSDPPEGGGTAAGTGVISCGCHAPEAPAYPFASRIRGYAVPQYAGTPASDVDDIIRSLYATWREQRLVDACGGKVVRVPEDGAPNRTVSEAHGYGMLLSAFMAGSDPNAKADFDALLAAYQQNQVGSGSVLMTWELAWSEPASCDPSNGERGSATDGDLDIAYALLLADLQWGSGCDGGPDYRGLALELLGAIRDRNVGEDESFLTMGDFQDPSRRTTRVSDFMPTHLRAFANATGESVWTNVLDGEYALVENVQTLDAPSTGLVPDFIRDRGAGWRRPDGQVIESITDRDYSYNACRAPWRIGLDALLHGDERALRIVGRINTFATNKTGRVATAVAAGWTLEGEPLSSDDPTYEFITPLAVAAVASRDGAWADAIFQHVRASGLDDDYYPDTVAMLSLLAISGNWWSPADVSCK